MRQLSSWEWSKVLRWKYHFVATFSQREIESNRVKGERDRKGHRFAPPVIFRCVESRGLKETCFERCSMRV